MSGKLPHHEIGPDSGKLPHVDFEFVDVTEDGTDAGGTSSGSTSGTPGENDSQPPGESTDGDPEASQDPSAAGLGVDMWSGKQPH